MIPLYFTACLLGAIQMVAARKGIKDGAKNAVVHTSVHIGEPNGLKGFGLAVDIKVEGVDEELLKDANDVCLFLSIPGT
jgi:organic hydroperoxide reductase OsmC/OhrA